MKEVKTRVLKIEEKDLNTLATVNAVEPKSPAVRDGRSLRVEAPALRHETKDVLKQLHANISTLEDLGGRLSFVLGEVRSLIRR